MTEKTEEKDFMDESNAIIDNVAEFIRQDTEQKGPNVTIESYEDTRGTFDRDVEVVVVTTNINGTVEGFEVVIEDEDDPQNIYLVEAEQRLSALRQQVLQSETKSP